MTFAKVTAWNAAWLVAALGGCGSSSSPPADASAEGVLDSASGASKQDDVSAADDVPATDDTPTICASLPAACPSHAPTFDEDIAPVLNAKCNTCHAVPDAGLWPLTNYDDVVDWEVLLTRDVEYCTMPPSGSPQLTPSEQSIILTWVLCGMPEYPADAGSSDGEHDAGWL
jgi:hypothetical protein